MKSQGLLSSVGLRQWMFVQDFVTIQRCWNIYRATKSNFKLDFLSCLPLTKQNENRFLTLIIYVWFLQTDRFRKLSFSAVLNHLVIFTPCRHKVVTASLCGGVSLFTYSWVLTHTTLEWKACKKMLAQHFGEKNQTSPASTRKCACTHTHTHTRTHTVLHCKTCL